LGGGVTWFKGVGKGHGLGMRWPGPQPPSAAAAEDDPLDAFMASITKEVVSPPGPCRLQNPPVPTDPVWVKIMCKIMPFVYPTCFALPCFLFVLLCSRMQTLHG